MTKINLIDTVSNYIKTIDVLEEEPSLAVDIETYVLPQYKGLSTKGALDVHQSSISTLQMMGRDTEVYVLDLIVLDRDPAFRREHLRDFLKSKEFLLAHNASFETKFFKKFFKHLFDNFWCTRVASQLIANATGNRYNRSASGNSLHDLVKDFLSIDLKGKGITQIEDWMVRPLSMTKLEYGAGDVLYLYKLKDIFESVLIPEMPSHEDYDNDGIYGLGMAEVLDIEMKFIQIEAECEYNGLPINPDLTKTFEDLIEDPIHKTGEKLKTAGELCKEINYATHFPMNLNANYCIPTDKSIRHLNSSSKLKDIILNHIGTVETAESKQIERMLNLLEDVYKNSTATFYSDEERQKYEEFLMLDSEDLFKRNKVAQLLIQYKKLTKQASMRISRYINPVTKRIHYNLNSLGAATGRCSSSNPNSQTVNSKVEITIIVEKDKITDLLDNTWSLTVENI